MLNTNLAFVCCYRAYFNRYLQLKLLIKNCLTIFFKSEDFIPPSTQVISMHF